MSKLFRGTYTAIITPFTSNNEIDWDALKKNVELQIKGGVEGIVFVGTTGESPTLTYDEHYEMLKRSAEMVAGRCKLIHGTGSNCTDTTIKTAKVAQKAGADGQLVINPYYNKPTQEGLKLHFTKLADASELPIIVYNIFGRTGVNMQTDTLLKLAEHPNIVSVKEASGDMNQMLDVIKNVPEDFSVLVGDDGLVLPFIASGGDGLVSVISNCLPKKMSDMVRMALAGNIEEARESFYQMLEIIRITFAETSPIPIKEMMAKMGLCESNLRLPLCRASEKTMQEINRAVAMIKSM